MIMTLQSLWEKPEVGRKGAGEFLLPLPRRGRAHTRCVVSLCQLGVAFRTSSTLPLCDQMWSTRHHRQGLCPCPQRNSQGSPGQGSSAQEGNPCLTAAQPPLQCQGSSEPSQLAESSLSIPGAVPRDAEVENSKPQAFSPRMPSLPSAKNSKYINKDHISVNQTLLSACLCCMTQQIQFPPQHTELWHISSFTTLPFICHTSHLTSPI